MKPELTKTEVRLLAIYVASLLVALVREVTADLRTIRRGWWQ